MRRRHFTLLEVLIAFTLVALCAPPLIRTQFGLAKKEIAIQREIERAIQADTLFDRLRLQIYRNDIPWKPRNQEVKGTIDGWNYTISVEKQEPKGRGIHYRVYRLLEIEIEEFSYFLFVEKLRSEQLD